MIKVSINQGVTMQTLYKIKKAQLMDDVDGWKPRARAHRGKVQQFRVRAERPVRNRK